VVAAILVQFYCLSSLLLSHFVEPMEVLKIEIINIQKIEEIKILKIEVSVIKVLKKEVIKQTD